MHCFLYHACITDNSQSKPKLGHQGVNLVVVKSFHIDVFITAENNTLNLAPQKSQFFPAIINIKLFLRDDSII